MFKLQLTFCSWIICITILILVIFQRTRHDSGVRGGREGGGAGEERGGLGGGQHPGQGQHGQASDHPVRHPSISHCWLVWIWWVTNAQILCRDFIPHTRQLFFGLNWYLFYLSITKNQKRALVTIRRDFSVIKSLFCLKIRIESYLFSIQ